MKTYWIDVYLRGSTDLGTITALHWKAEGIDNLRKRLVKERKGEGMTYVVFETPASKRLGEVLSALGDKGYRGTYYVQTIDGKIVPTWSVDQGDGWNYVRNAINKDGSLGRRL